MAEMASSGAAGSEQLKKDIATGNFQFLDFPSREELVKQLRYYAGSDISDADVPNFEGSIRFTNEEYVDLIKKLEIQKSITERQKILREVIANKTAGQVGELKTDIEAKKTEIKEALKDLAPERIESSLLSTEKILRMYPESQKTLLRGYAGSLILETFEKHGQRIIVKAGNEIEVNPIDSARATPELLGNNTNLRLKLNTLLKDGALNPDTLKIGMLYRAKSFVDYSNIVRAEDGAVMNPNETKDPNKYFEHLEKLQHTGYKLSAAEETLLASREGFADFGAMLPAIHQVKDLGQIQKVADAMNGVISGTGEKGAVSAVGEGIGQIGGTIGKIAGAGASGGIKVFGEILAAATKEGGAWGGIAVLGGLIAAIWKFGFWKTLGGIFGLGLANEAAAGRLDLKSFGSKEGSGKTPPEKSVSTPENGGVSQSEQVTQLKTEVQQDSAIVGMDREKFNTIFDGISASPDFKNQPILALENALAGGAAGSVELFLNGMENIGGMTGKQFYETHGQEDIKKILQALLAKKESADVTLSDLFIKSSVTAFVESESASGVPETETSSATSEQMVSMTQSFEKEGYSSLYILARALEMGFVPKLHDRTFKDAVNNSKTATWQWVKYKWAYTLEGGPFTNGTINTASSKMNNRYNEKLGAALRADALLEQAEIRNILKSPEGIAPRDIENLKTRVSILGELEKSFAPGSNPMSSRQLLRDYMAVSSESIRVMIGRHRIDMLRASIEQEKKFVNSKPTDSHAGMKRAKLFELEQELAKTPINPTEISRLHWEYEKLSGKSLLRIGKDGMLAIWEEKDELNQTKQGIEMVDQEITALKEEAKKKLEEFDKLAEKTPEKRELYKKEGERIVQEINEKITVFEKYGITNLQKLNPDQIRSLAKQSPWVDRVIKANSTADKLVNTKGGKFMMGSGLLVLAWDAKNGVGDMLSNGLTKEAVGAAGDTAIGFIPVVGWVHDLMIANADWYKTMWLGDRKLSKEELIARNAFGAVGIIPGFGTAAKLLGKWSMAVIKGSEVAIQSAHLAGKVGTYGYLGYSLGEATIPHAVDLYDSLSSNKETV